MRVAKSFRWEAAHRLPWHTGGCASLHGHSYRLTVEVEGDPDARGMLVDFKELKRWVSPIVEAWDHATLVADSDTELLDVLTAHDWKYAVLPYDTTAENLCRFVADHLGGLEAPARSGITRLRIRLAETETCYAELVRDLA